MLFSVIGVQYKTQLDGLNIGTSISNFGSDLQMDGRDLVRAYDADSKNYSNDKLNVNLKTDSFSLIFRLGLSYQLKLDIVMHSLLLPIWCIQATTMFI